MPRAVKVLVVDDHPVVRQGLARLISNEPDLTVCGEAEDVSDALEHLAGCPADIVIVDLALKSSDGIDLIRSIKERRIGASVLVLTMHEGVHLAERTLRAGARGFLSKHEAAEQVVTAIREILHGRIYVGGRLPPGLPREPAEP